MNIFRDDVAILTSIKVNVYSQLFQDQIPPFPTSVAMRSIESQLGVRVSEIFADISRQPIAAASLGQVYKGYFYLPSVGLVILSYHSF